jgi:hypothetical protein
LKNAMTVSPGVPCSFHGPIVEGRKEWKPGSPFPYKLRLRKTKKAMVIPEPSARIRFLHSNPPEETVIR